MPMNEEIIHRTDHDQKPDQPKRDSVHWTLADIRADFYSKPAEHRAPQGRAEQRVDRKLPVIHAHDSGEDADEMADHRQQPRRKNTKGAVLSRPTLRAFNFVR